MPWIVVAGRLPPPDDGTSRTTLLVLERLLDHQPVQVADLSPGYAGRSLSHRLDRFVRVLGAASTLLAGAFEDDRRLYLPAEAGPGDGYAATLAGLARLLGYTVFVHHRALPDPARRSLRTALLVRAGGPACRHLLPDPVLQRRFQALYPAARTGVALPDPHAGELEAMANLLTGRRTGMAPVHERTVH
ncbi:MAG TPA: hypothetical protein VD995_09875 [Azospirillum sp.]|nr:hypothetical protein [Azospirillum sp.]